MGDLRNTQDPFLLDLIEIIHQNVSDSAFGVSELADKAGMSRSNLLRKVQKSTDLSASVFIRLIRLYKAQDILQTEDLNVSEVSYEVGFGSPSYFVKCYREEFGYPPGEEKERSYGASSQPKEAEKTKALRPYLWYALTFVLLCLTIILLFIRPGQNETNKEKSIAVLPFQNDSNDSTNVYFINGMMEAILNNLQKIEDLRVISRTSVERYRNSGLSLPEIAEELDVSYLIEGSGQKVGDQILLTVQLIEANADDHMWSEQYRKQLKDVFALQADVAQQIAGQVEAKLSLEEIERINEVITTNLIAYDHYLKGIELINQESFNGIELGVQELKKAIELDTELSEAHAYIAISYFYDDYYRSRKVHADEIIGNAQKAYNLDPDSYASLIAMGLRAMHGGSYDRAIPFFEQAIELNPNSSRAYNFLSDIYFTHRPDNRKYIEYALKGIGVEAGDQDSVGLSYSYLHLTNALAQTGFLDLAAQFAKKSMALDDTNLFAEYVYAYILFIEDRDFAAAERRLLNALKKDTLRIDIVQEVAKLNYAAENFERAAAYYDKMYYLKDLLSVDHFEGESVKAAYAYEQVGREEDAKTYYDRYRVFAENDSSVYKDLVMTALYASEGKVELGMEHFKRFTNVKQIPIWFITFIKDDPILSKMSVHPDYEKTLQALSDNFWAEHETIKQDLLKAKVVIQ